MPSAHAKLSPSAAKRWLNCPGSVALCETVVDSGGADADFGTACHSILQIMLEGRVVGDEVVCDHKEDGSVITMPVTKEMYALVHPVYEWIIEYRERESARIFAEQKVEIGAPAFGLPEGILWGTSDVITHGKSELAVMDAKFGYNPVDVRENEQLLLYALGAAYASAWMYDTYRLVILQPRDSTEPKEWVITGSDLMKYEAEMAPKVTAAVQGGALAPSEGACRWCRAAGVCPALREETVRLARTELASALTSTPEEIAELLVKADMIENAITSIRLHATKLAETGVEIPGFKLVKGEKKRVWTNQDTAPKALKKLGLGEDQIFEKKLATPASVENDLADIIFAKSKVKITKKYAKEQAKIQVAELAHKPEGLPTLVPVSDSREALGPAFTVDDVKALEASSEGEKKDDPKPVDEPNLFD